MNRISFLFVEMDFPGGRGSSGKIVEFPGGGGSTARPSGTENPGGWGVKLEKPSVGGVWIFSGTTQYNKLHAHMRSKKAITNNYIIQAMLM